MPFCYPSFCCSVQNIYAKQSAISFPLFDFFWIAGETSIQTQLLIRMSEFFLFGPSAIDKLKRIRAGVEKEAKETISVAALLNKQLAKLKKRQDAIRDKVSALTEWVELARKVERLESRIRKLESTESVIPEYIGNLDKVNEAVELEMEWKNKRRRVQVLSTCATASIQTCNEDKDSKEQDTEPSDEEIRLLVGRLRSALVTSINSRLLSSDMTVPDFVNRNYCASCNRPLVQLNEAKLVCVCGRIEGNSDIPNTVLIEDTPIVTDRKHSFDDVLDIFRYKEVPSELRDVAESIMSDIWLEQGRIDTKVTPTTVKKCLEVGGKSRYARFANQIANIINDEVPPKIAPDQEFWALCIFVDLLDAWKQLRKEKKCTFPNYHLLFWFVCQMFDWMQFVPYLTMLRTEDKKEEQMLVVITMMKLKRYPIPERVYHYLLLRDNAAIAASVNDINAAEILQTQEDEDIDAEMEAAK